VLTGGQALSSDGYYVEPTVNWLTRLGVIAISLMTDYALPFGGFKQSGNGRGIQSDGHRRLHGNQKR